MYFQKWLAIHPLTRGVINVRHENDLRPYLELRSKWQKLYSELIVLTSEYLVSNSFRLFRAKDHFHLNLHYSHHTLSPCLSRQKSCSILCSLSKIKKGSSQKGKKLNKYSRHTSYYYARRLSGQHQSVTESFAADYNLGYNYIGTIPSDLALIDNGEARKVENEKSNQLKRHTFAWLSWAPPLCASVRFHQKGLRTM